MQLWNAEYIYPFYHVLKMKLKGKSCFLNFLLVPWVGVCHYSTITDPANTNTNNNTNTNAFTATTTTTTTTTTYNNNNNNINSTTVLVLLLQVTEYMKMLVGSSELNIPA